jgi:hypothetical protein
MKVCFVVILGFLVLSSRDASAEDERAVQIRHDEPVKLLRRLIRHGEGRYDSGDLVAAAETKGWTLHEIQERGRKWRRLWLERAGRPEDCLWSSCFVVRRTSK